LLISAFPYLVNNTSHTFQVVLTAANSSGIGVSDTYNVAANSGTTLVYPFSGTGTYYYCDVEIIASSSSCVTANDDGSQVTATWSPVTGGTNSSYQCGIGTTRYFVEWTTTAGSCTTNSTLTFSY